MYSTQRSFRPFLDNFRLFQKICQDLQRLRKKAGDFRRQPKMSEHHPGCPWTFEDFRGEIRKFSTLFLSYIYHIWKMCFVYIVQIIFQRKLLKPKKFCQIFLDGYHAGLLWAVKSEPTSTPFIWRIRSASMKVYWNFNNTRGKSCRCRRDVSTSPSTLTKGSRAVDKKLVPSFPQVSQNIVEHGSTKETTAPLSTGSIMDFPRANNNNSYWQS